MSLLASCMAADSSASALLPRLVEGDMLLLGARPGQGKTRLGLQLLLDAARDGRRAIFYTLEYTGREVRELLRAVGGDGLADMPEVVTSGEIGADFIVRHLSGTPRGSVAVVDYLQILDQQRSKPPLSEQIRVLHEFARESGVILGFISQIDRSFDPERASLPDMDDIRLPNPVPAGIFSKACFIHAGEARFRILDQSVSA